LERKIDRNIDALRVKWSSNLLSDIPNKLAWFFFVFIVKKRLRDPNLSQVYCKRVFRFPTLSVYRTLYVDLTNKKKKRQQQIGSVIKVVRKYRRLNVIRRVLSIDVLLRLRLKIFVNNSGIIFKKCSYIRIVDSFNGTVDDRKIDTWTGQIKFGRKPKTVYTPDKRKRPGRVYNRYVGTETRHGNGCFSRRQPKFDAISNRIKVSK